MKPSGQPSAGRAMVALGLTVLAWSAAPMVLRNLASRYDAWTVNAVRYTFTLLFWAPLFWRERATLRTHPGLWRATLVPGIAHAVGQVGWGLAPYYNSATVMNFVSRMSFLFVLVFGFWRLHEERGLARRPLFWGGVAAVLAGLAVLFVGSAGERNTSLAGLGILVWTSACWGLYAVELRRRLSGQLTPLVYAMVCLYVTPVLVALMLWQGDWTRLAEAGPRDWALLLGSALAGLALGHVLFYQGIRGLGPVVAEGSLSLIPFVTAVLAGAILGERLTGLQWIGGVVLVVGTLLLLAAKIRVHTAVAPTDPAG